MDNYELLLSKEAEENIEEAIATLISAAQDIANKSEQDFERIKEKKWYKRLWELVTFSKDNEKIQARGVSNLAKLNEIIMKAIVLLSKQSKNNADRIYEALQKIQSLTEYVSELYAQQETIIKKILAIRHGFESEGRFDELSDNQRDIICAVLDRFSAIGSNDNTQALVNTIRKSARRTYDDVTYGIIEKELNTSAQRWLFNLLQGYSLLLTNKVSDEKHEVFRYFPLSEATKENIRNAVKTDITQRLGMDNYIRSFEVHATSDDLFVLEDDIEWFFYEEDNLEEAEAEEVPQKEDVHITSLTQICSGDSLKFVDKNVYIQANIDCHGELMFLDCNVFYHCGESIGKITLSPGAELNVWDSHVFGGAYDDAAFIRGKQADINCTNSTFRNCNNFIDTETSEIYMDKCGVYNCVSKFICTKVDYMSGVGRSQITNTLIVIDDPQALELAKVHKCSIAYIFDIQRCEYKNNLFYYPAISSDAPCIILFTGKSQRVEDCTFIMLGEQHVSCANSSKLISNCLFVGGNGVVSLDGNSNLSSSMFIGCKNAVTCGKDTLKECTFVDCLDTTIAAKFRGSAVIENCTFMNTKVVAKKQKGKYEDEIGPCIKLYCDREFMEKGTNQPNKVTGCTFYHLNNYDYIIAPAAVGKPEETIAVIEDCHFANCDCAKAIKMDVYYYSEVLSIKKTVRDVMKVINPEGADLYSWRSGSGKTISRNEVNVDLRSSAYGCEYLTSINYLDDKLTSNEKLYPWIADFEQKVIAESE